jgi:hypothetical protein
VHRTLMLVETRVCVSARVSARARVPVIKFEKKEITSLLSSRLSAITFVATVITTRRCLMEPRVFLNGIIIIVTTDVVLGPERELGNRRGTRGTAVGFVHRVIVALYRLASDRTAPRFFHALTSALSIQLNRREDPSRLLFSFSFFIVRMVSANFCE